MTPDFLYLQADGYPSRKEQIDILIFRTDRKQRNNPSLSTLIQAVLPDCGYAVKTNSTMDALVNCISFDRSLKKGVFTTEAVCNKGKASFAFDEGHLINGNHRILQKRRNNFEIVFIRSSQFKEYWFTHSSSLSISAPHAASFSSIRS
jgi:hypothetical protein